jgi:hypothetical protein
MRYITLHSYIVRGSDVDGNCEVCGTPDGGGECGH